MSRFSFGVIILIILVIITIGNVESVFADSVKFDQIDDIIVDHSDIISFVDNSPFESGPIILELSSSQQTDKQFTLTEVVLSTPTMNPTMKVYAKPVMFSTTCAIPCSANELRISSTPGETLRLDRGTAFTYFDEVTTKAASGVTPNPPYGPNVQPTSNDRLNCATDADPNPNSATLGDGICDIWEQTGILNINGWSPQGGTMLQKSGPSPTKLDVYVEIDYLQGHRPNIESLWNVINASAVMGINLHIQLDDEGNTNNLIPHSLTTPYPGSDGTPGIQQISADHFGTCNERSTSGNCITPSSTWNNPTSPNWKKKAQVFHYALFAHAPATGSSTGNSELLGNDILITLGVLNNVNELVPPGYIEGTFMHELGHNLNLSHGGAPTDAINCKPTHMSVMSYSRQFTDLVPTRNLEYSRSLVTMENGGTLTESTSLSESNGIGSYYDSTEEITWGKGPPGYLPTNNRATVGSTQVDWNVDGFYTTSNSQYLNTINTASGWVICQSSPTDETLPGHNDLAAINYKFRWDSDWLNGVSVGPIEDPTIEEPIPFCFSPSAIINWYNTQNPPPTLPLSSLIDMLPTCAAGSLNNSEITDLGNTLINMGLSQEYIDIFLEIAKSTNTSSELTPDDIINMRVARVDSLIEDLNKIPQGDFYSGHSNGTLTYYDEGVPYLENLMIKTKKAIENHELLDAQDKLKILYSSYEKFIKNPTRKDQLKKGTADIYLALNKVVLGEPMVTNVISPHKRPIVDVGSLVLSQEFQKILPELVDIDGKIIEAKLDVDFIKHGKLLAKEWGVIKVGDKVIHHDVKYWKPYFLQNENYLDLQRSEVKCNDGFELIYKHGKTAICVKPATSTKLLSMENTKYSKE